MQFAFLRGAQDEKVPVRISKQGTKTLLICDDVGTFVKLGLSGFPVPALSPTTHLRGVFTPGEGAMFQLFDALGTVSSDVIRLADSDAEALLTRIW